jgi:hypothetical protein
LFPLQRQSASVLLQAGQCVAHHDIVHRYISETELKQEILQQERDLMRRVNLRESLRGAMTAGSMMSVSMHISTQVEAAVQECFSMMTRVSDKVLDLQDRQVVFPCRFACAHSDAQTSECLRMTCSAISIACWTQSSAAAAV